MVLRVYGHLMANSEDRMRPAVGAAWSGALDAVPASRAPSAPRANTAQR